MNWRRRVEQGLHNAPFLVDSVLPGEGCGVTDQCRMQQHFVRSRTLTTLLSKFHVQRDWFSCWSVGSLGVELDANTSGRIQLDHQLIRIGLLLVGREAEAWRAFEHEAKLGLSDRQPLACANKEWHA